MWVVSSALHGVVLTTFSVLSVGTVTKPPEPEVILSVTMPLPKTPDPLEFRRRRDLFPNEVPSLEPAPEPVLAPPGLARAPMLDDIDEALVPAANAGEIREKPMEVASGALVRALRRSPDSIGVGASGGAKAGFTGSDQLRARASAATRMEMAKAGSGGDDTENAVEHALSWLSRHQNADGRWSSSGFNAHCRQSPVLPVAGSVVAPAPAEPDVPEMRQVRITQGRAEIWAMMDMREVRKREREDQARREKLAEEECRRRAGTSNLLPWQCRDDGQDELSDGVTGLALLAFLGAGYSHKEGKYPDNVGRAIKYLLSRQQPNGRIGDKGGYCQLIPALAICEAYALSRDEALRAPAQKAVDWVQSIQSPGLAWRYGDVPGADNGSDVTLGAWGMQVLKAARIAGLRVDARGAAGVRRFVVERCARQVGDQWTCGYTDSQGPSAARTACGLVALLDAGESRESAPVLGMSNYIGAKHLPCWPKLSGGGGESSSGHDYYYWYYGAIGMYRMGDRHWPAWNAAIKKTLLDHQVQGGCSDGSWEPLIWSQGGRVCSTAMAALTLEVYYRYLRIYE